jgi:hypothetical protein
VRRAHPAILVAIVAYMTFVALATLTPRPIGPALTGPWCLLCGDLGGVDILQNLGLFFPLGVLLVLGGNGVRRVVPIAFLFSLSIELLQFWVISGRDGAVSDVLSNSLGALVGGWMTRRRALLLTPPVTRSSQLAAGWSAVTVGVLLAIAVALQPSSPRFEAYVQFVPQRSFWDTFTGRLIDARLQGRPVSLGLMDSHDVRYRALVTGRYGAEITVSNVQRTERFSPVFRIGNRKGEMFFLGQHHLDAVFRPRLRASDVGLRSPFFALGEALAEGRNPVRFSGTLAPGSVSLHASAGDRARERRVALSPSMGWALLFPFETALSGHELLLGALWLALLAFPAGYWGGWYRLSSSSGRWMTSVRANSGPVVIACGLVVAARVSGSGGVEAVELAGIVAGHLMGLAIAALACRGGRHRDRMHLR